MQVPVLETERLIQLLRLGAKVSKVLDWKDRLVMLPGGRNPRRRGAVTETTGDR